MIKEFIDKGFTGIHTGVIPEYLDRNPVDIKRYEVKK
jgi:hypothetical protein